MEITMSKFLEFVGNSLVFAHGANFDFMYLNKELTYHNLDNIPFAQLRCTLRIFKKILKQNDPLYDYNLNSLENCTKYFNTLIVILNLPF